MDKSNLSTVSGKGTFTFPSPPFLASKLQTPLVVGEAVTVRCIDGIFFSGTLVDWSPEAGVIEINSAKNNEPDDINPVPFDTIKLIIFPTLRRYESEIHQHPISSAMDSLPQVQDFEFRFKDGDSYQGKSFSFRSDKAGFYLFTEGTSNTYSLAFIPHEIIQDYNFGKKVGEILLESNRVDQKRLDLALQEQQKLRTKQIGQYLKESAVVTASDLKKALEQQTKTPNKLLGQVLLEEKLITQEQLDRALVEKKNNSKEPLGKILVRLGSATLEDIQFSLARKLSIPFIDLDRFEMDIEAIKLVPEHLARKHALVPVCVFDHRLIVALEDPLNNTALDAIRFHTNMAVEPVMATKDAVYSTLSTMYAMHIEDLVVTDDELDEEENDNADDAVNENLTVKLVNKIIADAISLDVSDIHIEPYGARRKTVIRFRKDGVMQHYYSLPPNLRHNFVARLKVMAKLDTSITRLPQDGKIIFRRQDGRIVELRIATIPTVSGSEDVVIRILSQERPKPIEWLGLEPNNLQKLTKCIEKPYGLFLAVGPTGSGKTTTLHSVLSHLNNVETKIWTVEDPVELTAHGLRQIQVNSKVGLTFPKIMRAILRADPDVIMLGEIRDQESADIALEASLTGHMVLGTLHTNNAPATIQRLLQMGMDAFNFGDALVGILAQRLARKLCDCATHYQPDTKELMLLAEEYCRQNIDAEEPEDVVTAWIDEFGKDGEVTLKKPVGCHDCRDTGYKGRIGVHELLINSDALQEAIFANRPLNTLRAIAIQEGMQTLKQDGILKVLKGLTDIKEIRKVCI